MFQIEPGLIIWTSVSFAALVALLYKMLLPPILDVMDKRERQIAESIEQAKHARAEALKLLSDYGKQMEETHKTANRIAEKSREEARLLINEASLRAKKESKIIVEQAKAEIGLERGKMIDEVKSISADLIIAVAGKILGREVKKEDNIKIIQESLSGIKEL